MLSVKKVFGVLLFVQGYAITETTDDILKAVFGGVLTTIVAWLTRETLEYIKKTLTYQDKNNGCNNCKIKRV